MSRNRGDADPDANAAAEPRPTRGRGPTMLDVARAAGVSKALVSIVFRDEPGASERTRQRVRQAAAAIGYRQNRTASRLARSRSRVLGVTLELSNSFHTELVEHMQAAADALGYEIALGTRGRAQPEQRAIETLLEFRCEAVILLGPQLSGGALAELAGSVPVVTVGRADVPATVDSVRSADEVGIGLAVDHLVELGHTAIAHIDGGRGPMAGPRRRGYRAAMRRHGLASESRVLTGDFTEEGGAAAARELLAAPGLPTAAVAVNDRSAVGLLDTLQRHGCRVPEDFSIVGYDDSSLARLWMVRLTSVSQVPEELAARAVAAAVDRLDGRRTQGRDEVVQPVLMVRATSAPPAG